MSNGKYIAFKYIPRSFNILTWFCTFTCLHYWHSPEWLYGVIGSLCALDSIFTLWQHLFYKPSEPMWKD